MLDENFEKKTKRLILRPYRESDFLIWKETFLNLPKPKNRWDKGPRPISDLTKTKFKKILSHKRRIEKLMIFMTLLLLTKSPERLLVLLLLLIFQGPSFKIPI
jgi:hypothetical protein